MEIYAIAVVEDDAGGGYILKHKSRSPCIDFEVAHVLEIEMAAIDGRNQLSARRNDNGFLPGVVGVEDTLLQ